MFECFKFVFTNTETNSFNSFQIDKSNLTIIFNPDLIYE